MKKIVFKILTSLVLAFIITALGLLIPRPFKAPDGCCSGYYLSGFPLVSAYLTLPKIKNTGIACLMSVYLCKQSVSTTYNRLKQSDSPLDVKTPVTQELTIFPLRFLVNLLPIYLLTYIFLDRLLLFSSQHHPATEQAH